MFEPGNFSKSGPTVEVNKQSGTSSEFSSMCGYKLQKKPSLEMVKSDRPVNNIIPTPCTIGTAVVLMESSF